MALVQANIDDDMKHRADETVARNGIITPMAMRMMITRVEAKGCFPLVSLVTGEAGRGANGRRPLDW